MRAGPTSWRAGRTRGPCRSSNRPTCGPGPRRRGSGLRGEYFAGRELQGEPRADAHRPDRRFRWDRESPTADLVARGELPADKGLPTDEFSVRWTGQLVPPVSGRYELTVTGDDGFRLDVGGQRVIDEWTTSPRARAKSAFVDLEAGKPVDLRLEYFDAIRDAEIRLAWRLPGGKDPFEEALDAARASDVVVFVGGLTGDVEGEEMRVSYPRLRGRRPHRHRAARLAGEAAARGARDGQAGRARPDHRLRDRRRVGAAEPARDPGRLVPRTAGRQRGRRRPLRRRQPRGPPARHLLPVRGAASALRRLRRCAAGRTGTSTAIRCTRSATASRTRRFAYSDLRAGPERRAAPTRRSRPRSP